MRSPQFDNLDLVLSGIRSIFRWPSVLGFFCSLSDLVTHNIFQIRPDTIVTESDFFTTLNNFQNEPLNVAINLTRRVRWDDGLDQREGGSSIHIIVLLTQPEGLHLDNRYGNSEMVRKWTKLGFVAQENYGPKTNTLPIYIEKERHPEFPHTGSDQVGEP